MPVWEAQYIIVIASQTGWTESFIRHELPLCRGWAYYHAARLLEGERCRWPHATTPVSNYLTRLRTWVRSIVK